MRKFNAILTVLILVLFLVHAVFGAFQLIGVYDQAFKMIARACMALIAVHTVIGIKLTADTLRTIKKSGAPYFRENMLFWARRISGLVIMILLCFHMTAFADRTAPVYRLKEFDTLKLVTQILLVLSIALHVITNVKPLLIAFGLKSLRQYAGDILAVLSIILLFFVIAFIIYYLRWQAI